jgi:arginine exporter protein ArgO
MSNSFRMAISTCWVRGSVLLGSYRGGLEAKSKVEFECFCIDSSCVWYTVLQWL